MKTERCLAAMICAAALVTLSGVGHAEALRRGPYLQKVSTTGVTLRWNTDVSTESRVWVGTQPDSLTLAASKTARVTNHEVRVSGLAPGSRYYYAVGSATAQLSAGTDHYFYTSPDGGKPTRIWVLGDSGTGTSEQLEVRNAYYNYPAAEQTDLILMLGDNAYEQGKDPEYQAKLFDVYGPMLRHTPLWPSLGNHDGFSSSSSSQSGPYFQIFTLPKAADSGGVSSNTEAYYSFDFGNIHFVALNSYDVSRAVDGPMASWLQRDLAANSRDWTIVYFHHPPYSKGSHDSDTDARMTEMRTNILPILEQHGVDLVLAGHSHSYERSMLLNGHYGTSDTLTPDMVLDGNSGRESETGAYIKPVSGPAPNAGTVYAVVGVSGEFKGGLFNHPAMYVSEGVLASMVIDINGSRLDAIQLDSSGIQRDSFAILKQVDGTPNNPPAVSITAPADGASFEAPAQIAISASATDDDGVVERVNFYAGSSFIGVDATEPFEYLWQSAPAGTHVLTAMAKDSAGATTTSAPQSVTVVNTTTTLSLQYGSNGYSGMTDASLRSNSSGTNFGSTVTLLADGSPDQGSVFRWDLSQVPTSAIVTKGEIRLVVTDPGTAAFNFYALKRPFAESKVTWKRAATNVNWQQAGANGSDDRETQVLGSLTPASNGAHTVLLNAAGVAKLQSWVANPTTNQGFILLNYVPTNGIVFHSSEAATVAVRPTLIVTYK